ncbi:MAG: hypothetical protein ACT4PE_16395, partial [Candidatus Eiseniibacteriota bacterium]
MSLTTLITTVVHRMYSTGLGSKNSIIAVAAAAVLLIHSGPASAQFSFDFALDRLSIDGNTFGSLDGVPDFVDDFNDGSVITAPTAAFGCAPGGPPSESGGFLNLRSRDGATESTDRVHGATFLVRHCVLGQTSSAFISHLRREAGDAVVTASFRGDLPEERQNYGLQIAGTDEVTNIQAGWCGNTFCIHALYRRSFSELSVFQTVFVSLGSASRVIFRLVIQASANRVLTQYSLDNGSTFMQVDPPQPGAVFTKGDFASVSVFGAINISLPASATRGPSSTTNRSGVSSDP